MATDRDSDSHSISTSHSELELDFSDLDDEQLYTKLHDLMQNNEYVQAETEMLERYLKRVEPKDSMRLNAGVTSHSSQHSGVSSQDTRGGFNRRRTKSRSSTSEKLFQITSEQKCEVASREIEELGEDIEQLKKSSETIMDTHKAEIDEADLRIHDGRRTYYEFEREVQKNARHERTGKLVAEKVIKYMEDGVKKKDTLIEKLTLKNSSLRSSRKKAELRQRQKEEMGEVLHEVDFNQLKIENQQHLERIEERNHDLLRLKQISGSTLLVLNKQKKRLGLLQAEELQLGTEVTSRRELLKRIATETESAELEREKAQTQNENMREFISEYKVPEVMDYVREKDELMEIERNVKIWTRKVEIAEMALQTNKKIWNQMKNEVKNKQLNPWDYVAQATT